MKRILLIAACFVPRSPSRPRIDDSGNHESIPMTPPPLSETHKRTRV